MSNISPYLVFCNPDGYQAFSISYTQFRNISPLIDDNQRDTIDKAIKDEKLFVLCGNFTVLINYDVR